MEQKRNYLVYYLPFVLFFIMLIDGHISGMVLRIFSVPMNFTSDLLLLFLLFATFQLEKNYLIILACVIGLLYDSYYYNVIGINLVLFPFIVLIIYLVFEYVRPSTITILLCFIVCVTLLSMGRAFLLTIFDLATTNFLDFFARNLAPTLALNIILVGLLVYPLKRWFNVK